MRSLLNEIKKSPASVPLDMLKELNEYSVRCGINEPFEKVYARNTPEFANADVGRAAAVVLISQLSKLQLCTTTGDLISKRTGDNIDGYPLLIGCYTLLRHCHTQSFDVFLDFLCKYAQVVTMNKVKSSESNLDNICIIRVLQMYCETFNYSFSNLESKLPLSLLTQSVSK